MPFRVGTDHLPTQVQLMLPFVEAKSSFDLILWIRVPFLNLQRWDSIRLVKKYLKW